MDYSNKVSTHYESIWKEKPIIKKWNEGPYYKLPKQFCILEFKPSKNRDMWTYATCGMSCKDDAIPIELHIFSSKKDDSIIELLTAIAYYHLNTAPLGLNHTVNLGRPWQDKSLCDYGFISLPYLDGPDLENLKINNIEYIKFYWLIPITKAEAEFKQKFGDEGLEEIFERKEFNYLDSSRSSLV